MAGYYRGKKVLVTGGAGMIGMSLIKMLVEDGAVVKSASIDTPPEFDDSYTWIVADLRNLDHCEVVCDGMDIVFNLVGIKGSPAMTSKKPASFFVPTLMFNTNMMEAARRNGVSQYLYTSTVGVYNPFDFMVPGGAQEDSMWHRPPSENDLFAGWAKRMGELQALAYAIEYGWDGISIVRPANVYGRYDNFGEGSMVVPSLIRRVVSGENPLVVWGDGSNVRDIIHADDVARGMMMVVEKGETLPVNLGSGVGVTIKEVVSAVVAASGIEVSIDWDPSKPSGDKTRLLNVERVRSLGWSPQVDLEKGIWDTYHWYKSEGMNLRKRYNVFEKG